MASFRRMTEVLWLLRRAVQTRHAKPATGTGSSDMTREHTFGTSVIPTTELFPDDQSNAEEFYRDTFERCAIEHSSTSASRPEVPVRTVSGCPTVHLIEKVILAHSYTHRVPAAIPWFWTYQSHSLRCSRCLLVEGNWKRNAQINIID